MDSQALLNLILQDYLTLNTLSVFCRQQLELANESQRQVILERVMGYDLHRRASIALLVDLLASRLQHNPAAQNSQSYAQSVQGPARVAQFILACQLGVYLPQQKPDLIDIGTEVAARYGQLELVQRLLTQGGSPAKALKEAALYGQMEVLRYVLPLPESKPEQALVGAASHGPSEAMLILLAGGAKLTYEVFDSAIEYNRLEKVSMLLKVAIGVDGSRLLAKVGHLSMLNLIREYFPDLDPIPSADKLLANALTSGDEELFGYAVGLGAGITSVASTYRAASVAEGGSLLMLKALEVAVPERDKLYFYQRVLTFAAGHHHDKLVEYILQKGLPLPIEDALMQSLFFDHGRLVGLLLTASGPKDLAMPLSEAVRRGYGESVELLLQAGARPSQNNLETARKYYPELEELLLTS